MTPAELLAVLTERKTAYQRAFAEAAGQAVLNDLMPFCRSRETCVVPGDRDRTYVLEGRREVYLRIRDHLDLTPEQLLELYSRPAQGAISHDTEKPDI